MALAGENVQPTFVNRPAHIRVKQGTVEIKVSLATPMFGANVNSSCECRGGSDLPGVN
jgi:hypothetical protein